MPTFWREPILRRALTGARRCRPSGGRRQRQADTLSNWLMTLFGLVMPTLSTMRVQQLTVTAIAARQR
jgi:hypothetical protein